MRSRVPLKPSLLECGSGIEWKKIRTIPTSRVDSRVNVGSKHKQTYQKFTFVFKTRPRYLNIFTSRDKLDVNALLACCVAHIYYHAIRYAEFITPTWTQRPRLDLPAPACAFLITREGRKH